MTLPIAFLLGMLAGGAVAWIARVPLRESSQPLRTRYGAITALFGLVLVASVVAFYLLEPAWAVMYLVHPDHAGLLVWPVMILGVLAAPALGLRLGLALTARGEPHWWLAMSVLAAALLATLLAGMGRLGTVAYYEVFHYGADATPLTATAIFLPVMATSIVLPMLFAYCLVHIQRHAALIESVPQSPAFDEPGAG